MMKQTRLGGVWLGAVAALALGACANDGGTSVDPLVDLEEDVCEHFAGGASEALTAGADAASAVDVTGSHTRYDISLVDVGGDNGGYVSIAIDEAAEYAIFVSADLGITVTDATGAAVTPGASYVGSDVCTSIGASYHLDLAVGTYTIALGPTSLDAVQLVYVEPGHDPEGEE